jgi:putative FmdB family regulatory protein
MPLYDYKCAKCSYVFEVQQRISEDPLEHCPKCKGEIKRLISPAGIIFKGSGFHVTDYAKKETKAPKKASPTESKTEKITEKKTQPSDK